MKMKKIVIFFTITLHSAFLSLSGMDSGVANMELGKSGTHKRKIATLGELRSDEPRKLIKTRPSLSHKQYDEFHRDIVRLIRKAYKKEKFHKQTSKLIQTLRSFSEQYPTEYLGFLEVVSILHSLIKQQTLNYPLIQYLFQQPKFLEIQLNVVDSNGNSLEKCIEKRGDLKLGIWFATATGRSNPIEDAKLKKLVRRALSLPCEEKIVCKWNNCSKTYDTYPQFYDHFKKEHKPKLARRDNKFHCEWAKKNGTLCNKLYSNEQTLIEHVNTHTGKFKCWECKKSFNTNQALTRHKKTHNRDTEFENICKSKIVCKWNNCSKEYTTYSEFREHFKKKHIEESVGIDKKLYCKWINNNGISCSNDYSNRSSLVAHINKHLEKFKCRHPGCEKNFNSNKALIKHQRTHKDVEFEDLCEIVCKWGGCSKECTSHLEFDEHFKKKHTLEADDIDRKFHCKWTNKHGISCQKAYKTKGCLVAHINKHVEKFKCHHSGCEKNFSSRCDLIIHTRIHTRERPFKCTKCDRAFIANRFLKQHMKSHRG